MAKRLSREQLSEIATELVRIKAQYYGKGPTDAKAFQNGDIVLCVLRGGMTTVERTLIEGGDEQLVRQVRLRFQEQMDQTFTDAITRIAGCPVVAYTSQVVFDPDYGFEIAVLGDDGDDPPAGSGNEE